MNVFPLLPLHEKLTAIDHEIVVREAEIAMLRKQRGDVQTAIRVVEELEQPVLYENRRISFAALEEAEAREAENKKPPGIPTMSEMILTVLADYDLMGPMEPKEIADWIRKRWWPEAPATSVGPIAWRMWKEGRLMKERGAYSLPRDETPAVSPAGVSGLEEPYPGDL